MNVLQRKTTRKEETFVKGRWATCEVGKACRRKGGLLFCGFVVCSML